MKYTKIAIYAVAIIVIAVLLIKWRKSPLKSNVGSETKVSNVTNVPFTTTTLALPIINYTDNGVEPSSLTGRLGAKVVWNNLSQADIEINSSKHPTHEDYPQLNLNKVAPKGSVSLIFNEPGTYKYHNHLKPSEVGTVKVE